MKRLIIISALLAAAVSCGNKSEIADLALAENFKGEVDGCQVALYTLSAGDITMQVTNFGARVVSLYTPDRFGKMADIVLGRGFSFTYKRFRPFLRIDYLLAPKDLDAVTFSSERVDYSDHYPQIATFKPSTMKQSI